MLLIWNTWRARWADDEGASMVEYALLVALIAIVAIIAVTAVGTSVSEEFDSIADTL